jgi:hypothetical protein
VTRAVTHRKGVCKTDSPKSAKGRAVVVPPHIRDDLKAHLEHHVTKEPEALPCLPPTENRGTRLMRAKAG